MTQDTPQHQGSNRRVAKRRIQTVTSDRRLRIFLALGAVLPGCGDALVAVEVFEQPSVSSLSVLSLVNGAELSWIEPADPDEELRLAVFLPVHGAPSAARFVQAPASPLVVEDLEAGVEYRVQLTTAAGRPLSPWVSARPFPAGALDPVPWYATTDGFVLGGFGASVTFTGDLDNDGSADIAVGAPGVSVSSTLEGAVYVFSGDELFVGTPPKRILGGLPLGMFGRHIAASEDVGGDQFPDLLVSSPNPFPVVFTDTAATPAGVLHVVQGGDGLAAVAVGPSFTGVESDNFGAAALGRDLDADLLADLWIGGPGADYVSLLSVDTSLSAVTLTADSGTRLGFAVTSGDYNDDGRIDLVVGEPLFGRPADPGEPQTKDETSGGPIGPEILHQGRVRVLFQNVAGGFDVSPLVGTTAGQMLGTSLATARVNDDLYDDLLVGASPCAFPAFSTSVAPGSISVWLGNEDGFAAAADLVLSAGTICLGRNVAAGDVNQDGRTDVIAGDSTAGADGNGELRVFLGVATGTTGSLPSLQSSAIEGPVGASLGSSISVGDLDGDGRSEVLAGAPGSGEMAGQVFLFRGAPRRGPAVTMAVSHDGLQVSAGGSFVEQEGPRVDYTCRFTWGDGESEEVPCDPGTLASIAHGYAAPGVYDVQIRVFSADDRFGEAVTRVTITAP